jgi:SpoVK/Ycf46/Vps4 family AAA+-type ATPase
MSLNTGWMSLTTRRGAWSGAAGDAAAAVVADYAHNLLVGTDLRKPRKRELRRIEDCTLIQEMTEAGALPDAVDPTARDVLAAKIRAYLKKHGTRQRRPRPPGEPLRRNLALIADLLGLTPAEKQVLQFVLVVRQCQELRELLDTFGEMPAGPLAAVITAATMLPADQVHAALAPEGRLRASGLLTMGESDLYYVSNKLEPKTGLLDLVLTPRLDRDRLLARFLPKAPPPTLGFSDFAHLGDAVPTARELLAAALRERRRGVNLLFYGATGTGKTELARLLAQELGVDLFAAGMGDERGHSARPNERLSSLLLGHGLLGATPALLLFDELEDLFRWDQMASIFGPAHTRAEMSKQWFNALLEQNPTPTIWITNEKDGIDVAFLRRFGFAIEFRPISVGQRARVLTRHLSDAHALTPGEIELVAQRYDVSPAQLQTAVSAARLIAPGGRPDRATLERVLAPIDKLVTDRDPQTRPIFDPSSYRIDVLNTAEDLEDIAARLAAWKPGAGPGISLCLYGPPGTGKSEFVRYLAARMGRRLIFRRMSDILSCWVGGTERNIAAAFREAEADDAVLLFDEVDAFLRDRREASHSWEVSETNEFLQQLEVFRGVVACTTNLWRDLDQAALRRFVFKVEFGYLRPEQAVALFETMFPEAPLSARERAELARLTTLTPGDFAAVARRVRALGARPSAGELCVLLRREVEAKEAAPREVGFNAAGARRSARRA